MDFLPVHKGSSIKWIADFEGIIIKTTLGEKKNPHKANEKKQTINKPQHLLESYSKQLSQFLGGGQGSMNVICPQVFSYSAVRTGRQCFNFFTSLFPQVHIHI